MNQQQIVEKTRAFLEAKFKDESTGHDYWHLYRVWQLAKHIAGNETGADMFVVELGALLHDIADWKFTDDLEAGPKAAREWLESLDVGTDHIEHVEEIIRTISYKGAGVKNDMKTLEGKIVSDADKLDAMGAVGIARSFAYGGATGRLMYDPAVKPVAHATFEAYKNSKSPTINHFYEKLLLLKDRLHTQTAKNMAQHRHDYMQTFLEEFYAEWGGEK